MKNIMSHIYMRTNGSPRDSWELAINPVLSRLDRCSVAPRLRKGATKDGASNLRRLETSYKLKDFNMVRGVFNRVVVFAGFASLRDSPSFNPAICNKAGLFVFVFGTLGALLRSDDL